MNFQSGIWLFVLLLSSSQALRSQGFTANATYSLNHLSDYGKPAREVAFGLRYQHPERWGLELEGGQTAYAHYQPDFSRGLENQLHQSWNARLGVSFAAGKAARFRVIASAGFAYRATTDLITQAVYSEKIPNPIQPDEPIKLEKGLYVLEYNVVKGQHPGWYAALTGTYQIGRRWGTQVRLSSENLSSVWVMRAGAGLFIQL